MIRKAKVLLGMGLLAAAPASFSQTYSVDLTGVGNGNVSNGVFVTPYQGTVQGNGLNYSGYLICDDYLAESYLDQPWTATMSAAGKLDGGQKFGPVTFENRTYTAQQAYDAAGWLANRLILHANDSRQDGYAFALWDLFDDQAPTAPSSVTYEQNAFAAVASGYTASNVSVLTPDSTNTQEFLMVRPAPEVDPAVGTAALTLLLGGALVLSDRRRQQV